MARAVSNGIEIAWICERNIHLDFLQDENSAISGLALGRWPELVNSKCLRFIDPWGDTIFNQIQLPDLLAELKLEIAEPSNKDCLGHLTRAVQLIERAQDQIHTYIKFIGD